MKIKHFASKNVTLFSKTNFYFSFKPFLLTQGIIVFAFILFSLIVISNFFIAKPQIADSQIIKNLAVKQVSAGIANNQPVKWTMLVKRSDISNSQNLVQLPKTARNIKVKNISKKDAENILAKTIPQANTQLAVKERQKLSAALNPSSFFTASLFSKSSRFFL
ncbi:MAG: hypothetical protein CEN87_394 [Parcubacteria group bacterium Licking1014_1]|nr:MAG: hypothetical protein CEN87_394 [Parcubacteria group bacterium Licking1014_1]